MPLPEKTQIEKKGCFYVSIYSKMIGCFSLVLILFLGCFCSPAQAESRMWMGSLAAFEPIVENIMSQEAFTVFSPSETSTESEGWVDTADHRVYAGDFSAFENMKAPDSTKNEASQKQFLLSIDRPDPNYKGTSVAITSSDRELLERIVMGECNSSATGAALVAQSLRDGMVYGGYHNASQVKSAYGYHASSKKPNQHSVNAVQYVFDQGHSAVQHRILYFYAPRLVRSSFHESQHFVVEYGGHRYFDVRQR